MRRLKKKEDLNEEGARVQPLHTCFFILALGFISRGYCSASHRAALKTCSKVTYSQKGYLGGQLQKDGVLAFCNKMGFQQDRLLSTHKPSLRNKFNKNLIWNCMEPVNLLQVLPIAETWDNEHKSIVWEG